MIGAKNSWDLTFWNINYSGTYYYGLGISRSLKSQDPVQIIRCRRGF
jgi:hypothetical protein